MTSPQRGEHDTPQHAPTDERLLAAVERAGRHHRPDAGRAAPVWAIVEHLGLSRRQGPGRRIRAHLEALVRRGWLERRQRHGSPLWELTSTGTRALEQALGAGVPVELPESPQHRAWRNARALAVAEIERFERELLTQLRDAESMLGADPGPESDAWFEIAERLRLGARRYGSAIHCLNEWPEPRDEQADIDEHADPGDELLTGAERSRRRSRRRGRRNIALWHARL